MTTPLGMIYSTVDSAKRKLADALANPQEAMRQYLSNANADAGQNLDTLGQTFKDEQGNVAFGSMSPQSRAAADTIAQGLMGAMAGTLSPGKLAPLREGPHYAVRDLSEYTPSLYRETSLEGANMFMPNSMSQPTTLHFANDPAYALGQGVNRGVLLQMDAKGMPGQLNLSKPTARQSYDSGYAEFMSRDVYPEMLGGNLQAVTVRPEAQKGPYFTRLKNALSQQGWISSIDDTGALSFQRPAAVDPATMAGALVPKGTP